MNAIETHNPALELLTKRLVVNCVRNTVLEDYHAGKAPVSHSGDDTDIRVIDADGQEFSWQEMSRISDSEMKIFLKQVCDRVFTFLTYIGEEEFTALMARYDASTDRWDQPALDRGMLGEKLAKRLLSLE